MGVEKVDKARWRLLDDKGQPVCNFTPSVLKMIDRRYSSGKMEKRVLLKLIFDEGESAPIEMCLTELECADWKRLDERCLYASSCRRPKQEIENFIRCNLNSASIERHYFLDKLGINKVEEEPFFLAGDRVITRSSASKRDIIVSPSQQKGFRLDIDESIEPADAYKGMAELIGLSLEVGTVLVAHTISGIIRFAFQEAGFIPNNVLFVLGKSGMMKSSYVPQIAQLYNRSDGIRADTRFNSTLRYLEEMVCENVECSSIIDDLHTAQNGNIRRRNEENFEEIIRRISDNTGRGRVCGNSKVQKRFSGNVIVIGEYEYGMESTLSRFLVVNMTKKPKGDILHKYQMKPLLVSTFYFYFIQWYVDHYTEICDEIRRELGNFRLDTVNSNIHGRLRDTYFYLRISYIFFLMFGVDSAFLDEKTAIEECRRFENQLGSLIEEQQKNFMGMQSKDYDYWQCIMRAYEQNVFELADKPESFDPQIHDGLIYYRCLCLRSGILSEFISRTWPQTDVKTIIRHLYDSGALKTHKGKYTVKISKLINGSGRFYAIRLPDCGTE